MPIEALNVLPISCSAKLACPEQKSGKIGRSVVSSLTDDVD